MFRPHLPWFALGWLLIVAVVAEAVPVADGKTLAAHVPGDVRLFLELRRTDELVRTPVGSAVASLLAQAITTTRQPARTRPVGNLRWRQLFAHAVGLENKRAAQLLFTGRLALAADGWSGIGGAVLLARPVDPAALEGELASLRVPGTAHEKVRRYKLSRNHELACNGRVVVVGQQSKDWGLYTRTTQLLDAGQGVALAELAEFRERLSVLTADCHLIFYAGMGVQSDSPSVITGGMTAWWPAAWPSFRSVALGVVMADDEVTVETSSRLDPDVSPFTSPAPPVDSLFRLPNSILMAWTHAIDFVPCYRRIKAGDAESVLRFYVKLLETDLPPGMVERSLLQHLVGDSVLMIDQVVYQPVHLGVGGPAESSPAASSPSATSPARGKTKDSRHRTAGDVPLLLPAMAFMVETDNPDAVADTMRQLTDNVLRVLNLPLEIGGATHLHAETVEPDGGTLFSMALGSLFADRTSCEFLESLEISWAVVDRWLVIATHPETVRKIILARRGYAPRLASQALGDLIGRLRKGGGVPEMILLAQPGVVSNMIDSWLRYIGRHHPEMLEPSWWRRIRHKEQASRVQLGIVPAGALDGAVKVAHIYPNWPAHNRLQPGDRILAVDGDKLDPQNTMRSLSRFLAVRKRSDGVRLLILRDGKQQEIDIPMPDPAAGMEKFPPIHLLRQLADVCRAFSCATHATWRGPPDVLHARLELRLASPKKGPQ